MEELCKFLQVFKTATDVLSGAKYSTSGLVLLFKSELERSLQDCQNDNEVIASLKRKMRSSLDRRLPTTDLHLCAAILDPSMRNLPAIQERLAAKGITGAQFLREMYTKYTGEAPEIATTSSLARHNSSQAEITSQPCKRIKLDLLAKHCAAGDTIDNEIQQFRCLSTSGVEDLTAWWRKESSTFPRLATLARCLLPIPATSAPSERVFSIAGLTINAKRASLAPSTVDKIIFVHENAHMFIDNMTSFVG
jgi:hypothetical protein